MEQDNNSNLFKVDTVKKEGEKLKPCCVCKETRELRDNCIRFNNETECVKEINKHIECLKSYGFNA
jgi:cytochrome c oxidase assembly protein subunit 17